jgi:hypothetical protein
VGETTVLDRRRGSDEALRRDLPAVQGPPRPEVGVPAPEEVSVDPLEVQQRSQVVRQRELVHRLTHLTHPIRPGRFMRPPP